MTTLNKTLIAVAVLVVAAVFAFILMAPRAKYSLAVMGPSPTIAVLPFVSMSSAPIDAGIPTSFTRAVREKLTTVEGIAVKSLPEPPANPSQPGLRVIEPGLGITHVIEGSLRQSEGRIVVTVQMIEVRRGRHLWSASYGEQAAEVAKLEELVANNVAEQVRARVDSAARPTTP